MFLCNKGEYKDILTKWLKFQYNFKFKDNFRTLLKFQDNWDPCGHDEDEQLKNKQ